MFLVDRDLPVDAERLFRCEDRSRDFKLKVHLFEVCETRFTSEAV